MARYIDAEKYPCKTCGISYCQENCKKFYEWLNGCDYDIQTVLNELEEELKLANEEKGRCLQENPSQFDSAKGYTTGIFNAIETIKKSCR